MRYVIASVAALGLAAFVAAQSPAGAQSQPGMTVAAVAAKLENQGYSVRAIELDDGLYEVEVVDRQGVRLKAGLDPATGEPVNGWRQDN